MALTKNDAVVQPYVRRPPPQDKTQTPLYVIEELTRLERTVQQLVTICPQVAISEPRQKLVGMIRWNKSPWDPLGTGDGLVKWNGSAWTAV